MSISCGTCSTVIEETGNYLITCSSCKKCYHSKDNGCSTVSSSSWYKKSTDNKLKWCCHMCGGLPIAKRKAGSVVDSGDSESGSDSTSAKIPRKSPDAGLLAAIGKMLDSKLDKIMDEKLSPLIKKIEEVVTKVDNNAKQINAVDDRVKRIENEGCSECASLKRRVTDLQSQNWDQFDDINTLQNYSRRDNVVFSGIPVSDSEDPFEVAIKAASLVGVDISRRDIVDCHRLPAPRGRPGSSSFIVKFVNRYSKNRIIEGYRKAKPMADKFGGSASTKVFANEHLSPFSAMLLREARKKLFPSYQVVKCNKGIVYVQKTRDSDRIRIFNLAQIGELCSDTSSASHRS